MLTTELLESKEFREAFRTQEQIERISSGKIASALVVFLMPAGLTLDYFVYEKQVPLFLGLRLLCSALAAVVWYLHTTEFGRNNSRRLGIPIPLLPAFFICWMIYLQDGAASPYYAGLNLILLAVSMVARWDTRESIRSVGIVLVMYLVACVARPDTVNETRLLFNNIYFLALTGIIVVTGNHFFYRLKVREFGLRYELDLNRLKLEETNQKLLELGQVKDRFFANISHELRTPLTLLISPLEVLLFQQRFPLAPEQKSLLETMQGNAMRLLKLINDLLDLVRLEAGRMEVKREPIEANDFVRSLNSATKQLADEKQLRLTMSADPTVGNFLADRDKLEKICLNLIFNAIKFTPAGGRVDLSTEKQGDDLVLCVSDTGVGISEKNLPHVFDRFWQADNSSRRKYKGVGIGLSLVKELTEIQGGNVSAKSEEGKGTTFTIRIPYLKADTELAATADPASAGKSTDPAAAPVAAHSEEWLTNLYRRAELFPVLGTAGASQTSQIQDMDRDRPTVLVADDEPAMVRFISSQIQTHYRVIEAVDGTEAVQKALEHHPDIILLDMNMPEKDGLQVCRELRADPSTQKIPIVLITARADEETKLASLSAGANDFLSKPFSVAELYVRLRNLVQSHQYQQTLTRQNRSLADAIDQLKETETQLVQTAKIASLGRMSAGIIHEINNPLNFATTGLYTLKAKGKLLPSEHQGEYAEILKDIEDGLKRVRNIVTDLRTFTHPDGGQLDDVEASEIVASAIRFLSNEWRDKIRITVDIPEQQTVPGNKNRLIQVVLNLLQNAIDALQKREAGSDAPAIAIRGEVSEDKSLIHFRDNGEGIPTENLDKIFDPFFTTKDVGQGMGLGLSICYRIVKESGGQILVKSETGKFTEFTLEFPRRRAQSTAHVA